MNNTQARPAVSTLGLLGVAFVVLKLTGVIGWSWWWVTVPFWGPLALAIGILLIVAIIGGLSMVVSAIADERRQNRLVRERAERQEKEHQERLGRLARKA